MTLRDQNHFWMPERDLPEGARLGRSFFARDGITVARELLGKVLVHETALGKVRSILTEVESYMGEGDKASHAYGGRRTARTEPMYHQGGTSYVYLIYGMYSCMNIAVMTEGVPQAVLLRGAVPADELSRRRMELLRAEAQSGRRSSRESREAAVKESRKAPEDGCRIALTDVRTEKSGPAVSIPASFRRHLADGPGRLCIAMDITRKDNDVDMVESSSFYVTEGIAVKPEWIRAGKRIGIDYAQEAADYLWRFYL